MLIPSQLMEGENLSNLCLVCPVEKRGFSEWVLQVTRLGTEMILLITLLPVCPDGLSVAFGFAVADPHLSVGGQTSLDI